MEAIVLAGGFGTRLREVVSTVPKPMAPIAGRPFLEILLDSMIVKGCTHVVLSLGYQSGAIRSHFGSSYKDLSLSYCIEDSPLGTGGAIRAAFKHCRADHVLIANGDTFLDYEADVLNTLWNTLHSPIIVARYVNDTSRYGRLLIEDGKVVEFMEKSLSGPGHINAGCYVLPTDLLDQFPIGTAFSFERDFLFQAVRDQYFCAHITNGAFIDIGIPSDYARARKMLAERASFDK
jgi:D-glycero-alpha-D-manno-heptose 1-phosphate guanylyltransferase